MKRTKAILLSVLGGLLSAPALASNSHFFELQFEAGELAQAVRARLTTNGSFCPVEVPCPGASGQCIVDRIEFPAAATASQGPLEPIAINAAHTINGRRPKISIPLVAKVQTVACAYDPACTTPEQDFYTTLEVTMNIGSGEQLCFTPSGLGIPVPVPLPISEFCIDLDVSSVNAIIGQGAGAISGRALAFDSGTNRIGARFELGVPDSAYNAARINAWSSFLGGNLSTGLNGQAWSSFLHRTLLEDSLDRRLVENTAGTDVALLGAPNSVWTGLGASGGQLDLSVGAEYDGCVDISPLTIQAFIAKNATNTGFALAGSVGWDADTWDTIWCGFQQAGPFGAIAGPIIAGTVDLTDLGGFGGNCQVTSDSEFLCNETTHPMVFTLGGGWTMDVELSQISGTADGLAIGGPITFHGPGLPNIDVVARSPSFGFRGSCGGGRCGYEGGVFVSGTAKLCGPVELRDDPLNLFRLEPPAHDTLPAAYGIDFVLPNNLRAQFEANPYGPTVVVRSSVGVRAVQMAPPVLKDSATQENLQCMALQVKYEAERCMRPKWRPYYERFHPEWVIDPWDRHVLVQDYYSHRDLGLGLVEELEMAARTDPATGSLVASR